MWNKFQADVKAIQADPGWSEQGKREQIAKRRAAYDVDVERLRTTAKAKADSERRTAQLALSLEQAREIKALRAVLGDVQAAVIIKERLEDSTSAEIAATFESVKDDAWGAAIVRHYGARAIRQRTGERPKPDDVLALQALAPKRYSSDVEYENRVADLAPERVERWLGNLDRGAYQADIAQRFHVSAQNVPMPE